MPPRGKDGGKKEKKKVPATAADKGCEYIKAGELENLEKTLEENKNVINKHEVKSGKNMLHTAVEEGRKEFVDMILDYGKCELQSALMCLIYHTNSQFKRF